jgi:hypothetical protein
MLRRRWFAGLGVAVGVTAIVPNAGASPVDTDAARTPGTAEPAMTGLEVVVPNAGVLYVPSLPTVHLSGPGVVGRVASPRGSELFAGFGFSEYAGGGLGLKPLYSMGVDAGWGARGVSTTPFSSGGQTYAGYGVAQWLGVRFPSVGFSWHKTGYILSAQLVPSLVWLFAHYQSSDGMGGTNVSSGTAFLFTASADVQACREYNLTGSSRKNWAVCLYATPMIYADGFFNGASFGVRSVLF